MSNREISTEKELFFIRNNSISSLSLQKKSVPFAEWISKLIFYASKLA